MLCLGQLRIFDHFAQVGQPCHMTLVCSRAPIYIGGRYWNQLKHDRSPINFSCNVSQTRWIIDNERKGEASVEVCTALSSI
uniref:Putative tRNA pseudouridine synthase Pus10 isoform X2 n=1 Tax=Tanacetum cinerariifolium TaxID=118510 RepID=A0A699JNI3_TANCI|nr:putative tRNA pseudouridine synthase Pus10 isoform X2 [Tanacetum cinerariifolium]